MLRMYDYGNGQVWAPKPDQPEFLMGMVFQSDGSKTGCRVEIPAAYSNDPHLIAKEVLKAARWIVDGHASPLVEGGLITDVGTAEC